MAKEQYISPWREEDDTLLRRLYVEERCPVDEIAETLGRTESSVRWRASELGLHRLKVSMKPSIPKSGSQAPIAPSSPDQSIAAPPPSPAWRASSTTSTNWWPR